MKEDNRDDDSNNEKSPATTTTTTTAEVTRISNIFWGSSLFKLRRRKGEKRMREGRRERSEEK